MKCLKASTLVSLVASVGAIAAVSAPAKAVVTGELYYVRPAMDCVYVSGAELKTSSYGNIYNSSTTATTSVVCPIELDYVTSAYGVAGVEVVVSDKSTAGNITCSLAAVTLNGATSASGTAASTTGSTSVGVLLTLLPPVTTIEGYNQIRCTLPKKGGSSATITSFAVYLN